MRGMQKIDAVRESVMNYLVMPSENFLRRADDENEMKA